MDNLEKILQNPVVFKSVYELIEPEDTMNVGEIYKVAFTKIYQCFEFYREGKVLEAVSLIIDKPTDEVLKYPANDMMKFIKWLEQEILKCSQLMSSIPSVRDEDMVAAGVSNLDEMGEFNIYYAISKDPSTWDAIANTPFELMFIKIKIDGINSVIQQNYNEIIRRKK